MTECTGEQVIVNPPADPSRGGNCCEDGIFVQSYNCTMSKTIAANSKDNLSFPNVAIDGYVAVGIVGYNHSSSQVCAITAMNVRESGYVDFEVYNPTSSDVHVHYSVNILYVKSDFIREK